MVKDLQGQNSNRLLSIVLVIVFLLLCSSAAYLPRYLNFNPDEARIVIETEELGTGWFDESSWFRQIHLTAQVQYYLLAQVTTVTIRVLHFIAAVFFILTLVYVIWLSRAYALFSKAGLLVLLLLISTNGPLYDYGLWGVFDYSQRILQSVFLLHMLLFLHKRQLNLSKLSLALMLFGFCLFTIGYTALLLPIVILLVVAFLCRRTTENGPTRSPTKAALKNGLILLIPVMTVGLITLTYASHLEFLNPRPEIHQFFFPLSDHPQNVRGLLAFLFTSTIEFLFSTFYTFAPVEGSSVWPPAPDALSLLLSLVVALGFVIGLIRSLFEKNRDPTRFVIGAYVFLVLVCLVGLAVTGFYAFGSSRYALFIYIPLLMIAAYGIGDVGRLIARRLLPPSFLYKAQGVGLPILLVVALMVSNGAADLVRSEKSRFNAEFGEIIELIKTDRSPLLFCDIFAEWNLRAIGIDEFPDKRKFLFNFPAIDLEQQRHNLVGVKSGPGPWEVVHNQFRTFVASQEDVLWITYHLPSSEFLFAPFITEVEKTHFKADDVSMMPWQITRWKSKGSAQANNAPLPADNVPTRANIVPSIPSSRSVTHEEARRLLPAYGQAIEAAGGVQGMVVDASWLPDSKDRIKSAILLFLKTPKNPEQKQLLETIFLGLAWFKEGVGETLVAVDAPTLDGGRWLEVVDSEVQALTAALAEAGH